MKQMYKTAFCASVVAVAVDATKIYSLRLTLMREHTRTLQALQAALATEMANLTLQVVYLGTLLQAVGTFDPVTLFIWERKKFAKSLDL